MAGSIEFDVLLKPDPATGQPRPARIEVRAAELGAPEGIDPASIEVLDENTGQPVPCRWEDLEVLPDPFEDVQGYWTGGVAPTARVPLAGLGRLYNVAAPGRCGRLVFLHTARQRASTYRVRARAREVGETHRAAPRPWIGDGDPLFVEDGGVLGGLLHARPALVDLGRGGPDLLVGNILGHILHYRYERDGGPHGCPWVTASFLEADGERLDVGWYAAPTVCDWNGNGLPDLLVGEGGCVLFYQNVGTATEWQLELRGPIEADGQPIGIPFEFHSVYPYIEKEYIAAPTVCDWNGDGIADLLVGGYLTGLIYHYKSVGVRADGTPELTDAGYLMADGEILDVGWGAVPAVGDFAGSGVPGLVAGMMDAPGLQYYANVGRRAEPELARKPLAILGPDGEDLELGLTYPCPCDLNGNGRLDLVVGSVYKVHVLEQVTESEQLARSGQGARSERGDSPELTFRAGEPLEQPWGPHQIWAADGFRDDRGPAFIAGNDGASLVVHRRDTGTGLYRPDGQLTCGGEPIYRRYPDRDPWNAPYLRDIDGDGQLELLMGDSVGNVWLHRAAPKEFDADEFDAGTQLCLQDGRPVNVGLDPGAEVVDWDNHVGDRSDPVGVDVDGDGVWDLLVGDAHGAITFFANVGTGAEPVFAAGEVVAEGKGRVTIAAADWDGDGQIEIFASWSSAGVQLLKRGAGGWVGRRVDTPWMPYPHPMVMDLEGCGETDLVLSGSYGFVHLFRRAFVEHGYSEGQTRT